MQLVLQPCGDSDAVEHYVDTIQNPVSLTRILPLLPPAERERVSLAFGESVAVWGVTPGKNQVNARKWSRMQLGDVAMLYRNRRFFFKGAVAYKIHSPDIARELWKERSDGVTWEYVFFLTDLEQIDIDVVRFNAAARYKANNIIQGFNVLSSDQSEAIIEALDLDPVVGVLLPAEDEIWAATRALENLEGDLDVPANVLRRAEQALLRKIHLGGKKSGVCAICAKVLPVDLLVIGHIRKRHSCDPSQKRDAANVMAVCLLGCDKLFENGYIYVDASGIVRASTTARGNPQLDTIIDSLEGTTCLAWTADSAPYFRWHREHPRRPH
ncbi:hypothetical protein KK141_19390 [Dyella sp. LX-66]|uniref:hypothetical protein n=1 Tax=unclassified Dyella TaxID=2634549 RepID=UPI001BE0D79B|nr:MULTISPECIES: hypothetical protein [unclassified Dyella]MBT2119563.1 hypothetical protein [Dyella sp. LX-1]MBT2141721.1 hypothetical protein [Dyella sp. LX-66]